MITRTQMGAVLIVGILLVLSPASVSAGGGPGGGVAPPVVIAVEGPQSGEQTPNGLDQVRGVRLAVRQLNAGGGLWDGRKVSLFAADDKAEVTDAIPVARQVIAKGIHFVIGPYNSSVGLANLPLYRRSGVLPVWMTSSDETAGFGVTVQPMNSQIAPIEEAYLKRVGARKVAMLVDDTANGAFTMGMATRLRAGLMRVGATVTWTSLKETTAPGLSATYYADLVTRALSTHPDLVYVSTYFPEGAAIAKALTVAGSSPRCLMGLGNVDEGFTTRTTLAEAQRCDFSGVPAATEMPSAKTYVRQYTAQFGRAPGVWGAFTYDSARMLFAAIDRAHSTRVGLVERQLRGTTGFRGATGRITISRQTGYRVTLPVAILRINSQKRFVPTG